MKNVFVNMILKVENIKEKFDRCDYIKNLNFCILKVKYYKYN